MTFSSLLHAHSGGGNLFLEILTEVVWHGFLDTLKIIPFLFLTYLFMEFLEHKASDKLRLVLGKSGAFAPALGGLFGAVPQCGFSLAAANLYTGRVITLGTLIAVFLSTSDEMLPIMLSADIKIGSILLILLYKATVGIVMGYLIDLVYRLSFGRAQEINIDELCDEDGCHCERGIFPSALHHTLTVGGFILLATLIINLAIFFIGEEGLASLTVDIPIISHLLAAILGIIPNCATSVLFTDLAIRGIISAGTMLSGLFSGAGVGILVLFKINKRKKENLLILGALIVIGTVFGALADLTGLSAILGF